MLARTRRPVLGLCLAASAILFGTECTSSDGSPAKPDAEAPANGTIGPEADAGDAGVCSGACTPIALEGTSYKNHCASVLPVQPTGGTIVPGTYVPTSSTYMSDVSTCTDQTVKKRTTWRFGCGNAFSQVDEEATPSVSVGGTFTTSGTTLTLEGQIGCDASQPVTQSFGYSAAGDVLRIFKGTDKVVEYARIHD